MSSFSRAAVLALSAFATVQAHTVFTTLHVNGQNQGDGTCVRMSTGIFDANIAVPFGTDAMACNRGDKGVDRVCSVPDGATVSFEWRFLAAIADGESISKLHLGPCAVYMKKVDSAIEDAGAGDGWFKIMHEGFDEAENKWCTTKLIENNGILSVKLPVGLLGGTYLLRPELLALDLAFAGDPQFYTGCAQIFLESNGTAVPADTVSIPGYISKDHPGVNYMLKAEDPDYQIPGPEIQMEFIQADSVGPTEQTEGLRPAGCILENANFCAEEIPDYSNFEECSASSQKCDDQKWDCHNSAPATGSKNCEKLDEKCANLGCFDANPSGPPNKGVDLTPEPRTVELPDPYLAIANPCKSVSRLRSRAFGAVHVNSY